MTDIKTDKVTINGVSYVREDSVQQTPMALEDAVIVRAHSGVFFGYLEANDSDGVTLKNARQIWSWDSKGLKEPVNTCGDMALRGVGTGSKVSSASPKVEVKQVGAMFYCTAEAASAIEARKWGG